MEAVCSSKKVGNTAYFRTVSAPKSGISFISVTMKAQNSENKFFSVCVWGGGGGCGCGLLIPNFMKTCPLVQMLLWRVQTQ
jgi:hypothetical protein